MKPARVPLKPAHPDRICWGCDKYCPADDLACGNGTIRTLHPIELFGEDWLEWSEADAPATAPYVTADRARRRDVMSPMD
jgi:hypothetical protein